MEELNPICPICGEEIPLEYPPEMGEIIYCPQCGGSSEVIRTEPLTLQELKEEQDFLPGESDIF